MAKRTASTRRHVVALDDLAPTRDLRAGAGPRVFGAGAPAPPGRDDRERAPSRPPATAKDRGRPPGRS